MIWITSVMMDVIIQNFNANKVVSNVFMENVFNAYKVTISEEIISVLKLIMMD